MEDYGNRDWELPCVCGHLKRLHRDDIFNGWCIDCRKQYSLLGIAGVKHLHKFQLDNLALVEQIARARELI